MSQIRPEAVHQYDIFLFRFTVTSRSSGAVIQFIQFVQAFSWEDDNRLRQYATAPHELLALAVIHFRATDFTKEPTIMKYTFRLITLALTTAATSGILGAQAPNSDAGCCTQPACAPNTDAKTMPAETLTALERSSLIAMRREEKLAHDVYIALGKQFELKPFQHIPRSESRHMEVMLALLNRYSIPDPVNGLPEGQFDDEGVQKLYDDFVARGSVNAVDALAVGAEIEELDIRDLRKAASSTERADIQQALSQLELASGNHLRAFARNLSARGVTYIPKHLSQADYDKVLSSS